MGTAVIMAHGTHPTASQRSRADTTAASGHAEAQFCISSPDQTSLVKSSRPCSFWLALGIVSMHKQLLLRLKHLSGCQTQSCRQCCLQHHATLHKPRLYLCTHFAAARVALRYETSSVHVPKYPKELLDHKSYGQAGVIKQRTWGDKSLMQCGQLQGCAQHSDMTCAKPGCARHGTMLTGP